MKISIISLLIFVVSTAVGAQNPDSINIINKFYVGASFNYAQFHIYYKERKGPGTVRSGYFTPVAINFGYKFNARASIQVGLAYGGDKHDYSWQSDPGIPNVITYHDYARTQAIALPVTMRFIFLNRYKRFPVYVTACLMPAFGVTRTKVTQTRKDDNTTTSNTIKDSGSDTFATAGIGFNYKIKKRFSGYAELNFYRQNLTSDNSLYYDWHTQYPLFVTLIRSLSFGVNYNL